MAADVGAVAQHLGDVETRRAVMMCLMSPVLRPRSRTRTRRFFRVFHPLPMAFLLSGSALALAFGAAETIPGTAILAAAPTPLDIVLVITLVLLPPSLLAMVPAMRYLEGVAVVTLLGADLGGDPAPSRSPSQRVRTAVWCWLHLTLGAATAIGLVFGVGFGAVLVVGAITDPPSTRVLDIEWAVVAGDLRDVWLIGFGVLAVLLGSLMVPASGQVAMALAPGLLGPTPEERIAALDARTSQLVERNRLARELHDSVGHALSVVVLQSAVAKRRLAGEPEMARSAITDAEDAARTALTELDDVLGLLRDDPPVRRGPIRDLAALSELIKVTRTDGQQIKAPNDVDLGQVRAGLPALVSREAYRIIQEGLTNALKHAPGAEVTIELTCTDHGLSIIISNPIIGQPRRDRLTRAGRGLRGSPSESGSWGAS